MERIEAGRIALGVQQPWAELILQGVKTIEVRSAPTRLRGRIYLYVSRKDSAMPCAAEAWRQYDLKGAPLSRGCIIGEVDVLDCRPARAEDERAACVPVELLRSAYSWMLGGARRYPQPLRTPKKPYGVWFYPFRNAAGPEHHG